MLLFANVVEHCRFLKLFLVLVCLPKFIMMPTFVSNHIQNNGSCVSFINSDFFSFFSLQYSDYSVFQSTMQYPQGGGRTAL